MSPRGDPYPHVGGCAWRELEADAGAAAPSRREPALQFRPVSVCSADDKDGKTAD